jgi:hypothetical protein
VVSSNEYAIDTSEISELEQLAFCDNLVCFEEEYAANEASSNTLTLAHTVMGNYEPEERFNFFTSQFGSGFPLLHTGQKSQTDRFDATNTTLAELSLIQPNKKQPRFAKTNSKFLAFTVPNTGTMLVEDFYKLSIAIRKAIYLGSTLKFEDWHDITVI